jgi:hypothetical protein
MRVFLSIKKMTPGAFLLHPEALRGAAGTPKDVSPYNYNLRINQSENSKTFS